MSTISQLADGVIRIDIGPIKSVSGETLSYSLVHLIASDGEIAIIDPGPAVASEAVLEGIRGLGYEPADLSYVILTHIHLDHAGAAGTLAQQLPNVKVVVHRRGASHLINPEKLIEGTRQAYGRHFETDYGPILPVPKSQVQAVDDGEIINIGLRQLKIIYTPGHASHHMCLYDLTIEGIFSGDSLGFLQNGSNALIIVSGFDLELALSSMDRLRALNPRHIFAAHGTSNREPGEFIDVVKQTTKDYGDIILKALMAGENQNKMAERLLDYHRQHNPDDPFDKPKAGSSPALRRFDEIIPWYIAYFKKKGLA